MMGFYCVPQSIGLVRELKAGQRNRSVGKPICMESGYERASKSTTLDRSRSNENVYEGYRSGEECWDAMVMDADEYRSTYTDKNGKERSRRLPKQSIIGVQVIINPPSEVADTWDRATHFKFQNDGAEVLEEIEPRLFSSKNVMMRAHHFDEGLPGHATDTHTVFVAKDEDGRYCGSIYDSNLRQRMALEFAQKMRDRGWDIDDPEITDWDRYENDEEYRASIQAKRSKQGKSQPEYDAQKRAELADQMSQTAQALVDASEALETAQAEVAKAKEERDKWEHARELVAGKSFKRNGVTMLGRAGEEERRAKLQAENDGLEAELKGKRKAAKDEIDQMKEAAKRETEVERKRILAKASKQAEADLQALQREIAGYAQARRAYETATPEVTVSDIPIEDAIPVIFEEAEKMAAPREKRSMVTDEVQGYTYDREGQKEAHTGIRAALRYLRAWMSVGGRNAFQVLADKVRERFIPRQREIPQSVVDFTEEHDAQHGLSWNDGDGGRQMSL